MFSFTSEYYTHHLQADEFPTLTTNSPTTSLAYQSSKHPALNVNEPKTSEEREHLVT